MSQPPKIGTQTITARVDLVVAETLDRWEADGLCRDREAYVNQALALHALREGVAVTAPELVHLHRLAYPERHAKGPFPPPP